VRFTHPFWNQYQINSGERILDLEGRTIIKERLQKQDTESYSYMRENSGEITEFSAIFKLVHFDTSERVQLEWEVSFKTNRIETLIKQLGALDKDADLMSTALSTWLTPKVI
jgi:hypothetical protein